MGKIATRLAVLLFALLSSLPLKAQSGFTTVIATVKDPQGNLYVNAPFNVSFIDPGTSGKLPLLSGSVFQKAFTGIQTDSFGTLSISLPDNGLIASSSGATGTQWRFSFKSNTNPTVQFAATLTINCLANQPAACNSNIIDISAALQAVSASLPGSIAGNISVGTVLANGLITGNGGISTTTLTASGAVALNGGGSMQGTWTAGPSYTISTVTETGNVVTVTTSTPCSAITAAGQSIVVSGVSVAGYNTGPSGLVGFFTAGACAGSTFTYFNPTSGLGASSGGTVTVSPIFSQGLTHSGPETITGQLTMTNHNQVFWAGPGATPTIDQAVTACGTNPCVVEISPLYTGAESANLFTTSIGYKVYNGPNNVTIHDMRAIACTPATPTCAPLYGVIYGGRLAGQLVRLGTNYYSHSAADSSTGASSFNWVDGVLPSNGGQQAGSINVLMIHDAVSGVGVIQPSLTAVDSEAHMDATSLDADIPYIAAFGGQTVISRATTPGFNLTTSTVFSASACSNVNGVTTQGQIINCYGFDAFKSTAGRSKNYGYHSAGSWLTEVDTSFDFNDTPQLITNASEAAFVVTITTSGTCIFTTGTKVNIFGEGTTDLGYNGTWTVLTPGCNGGNTFTYTNTASGLATIAGGTGRVQGVHKGMSFESAQNAVVYQPFQDSVGWVFKGNDNSTSFAQINSAGLFGAGTVGPLTDNGAFLGGSSKHFAGIFLTPCAVNSVSPAACGAAAAGAFVVPTTTTTYTVNTTDVTAASVILITPRTYTGNLPSAPTCIVPTITAEPVVSAISAGTSFTIALTSTAGQTCWNFLVIN